MKDSMVYSTADRIGNLSAAKILKELSSIVNTTTKRYAPLRIRTTTMSHRASDADEMAASKNGYIVAFVIIFVVVLFIIVGRVIYSSNESSAPNLAYLKYHRASLAASALNRASTEHEHNNHANQNQKSNN